MVHVLVTGVTGFVGTATTLAFLKHGHSVRGTVRSQQKAETWESRHPEYKGKVEWAIVEDVAASGAFDEAVKGVDAIAHVASPFHYRIDDNEADMLRPALNGTLNVLKSAHSPSSKVKKIVITSSFAAILDLAKGYWPEKTYTGDDWNPATYEEAKKSDNPGYVYCASKTVAEQTAWNFLKTEKPQFSITTICPPMIFGPPLQPVSSLDSVNESAANIWKLFGAKEIEPTGFPVWVDVRDVAEAHVLSVEKDSAENKRYIFIAGNFFNEEMVSTIKKVLPDTASRLPPGPDLQEFEKNKPKVYKTDSTLVQKELGIKFTSFEDSMRDTVEELLRIEKSTKA